MPLGKKTAAWLVMPLVALAACNSAPKDAGNVVGDRSSSALSSQGAKPTETPVVPDPSQVAVYRNGRGSGALPGTFGKRPLQRTSRGIVIRPNGQQGAGYVTYQLGHHVQEAGAVVTFQPKSLTSFAIVIPLSPWLVYSPTGDYPLAGVHLVMIGRGYWNSTRWDHGEQQYGHPAKGPFADVRDGKPHAVEVTLHGKSVTLLLPDGSKVHFSDPAIAKDTSDSVTFEEFALAGSKTQQQPPAITKLWAN